MGLPDRLEAKVVVDSAIGEHRPPSQLLLKFRIGETSTVEEAEIGLQDEGREGDRKGRRGSHRLSDEGLGGSGMPDLIVPDPVRPELEADSRLEIRGTEDELGPPGIPD
jgi:hypothetical protein